jgi:hypothetical protein
MLGGPAALAESERMGAVFALTVFVGEIFTPEPGTVSTPGNFHRRA